MMATYTLPTHSFDQEPFFSWIFHNPIVAGSFFVFKTSKGKLQVTRILEATKANLFIPFDEWEITNRSPVANRLGKNVVTQHVVIYNFDSEVHNIAFVFKENQLFEHGAMPKSVDTSTMIQRWMGVVPSHP
jgi:hypothetical protein